MVTYILELNADESEARDMLFDNGIPKEEVNEQEINRTIDNLNEMTVDDFYFELPTMIKDEGYSLESDGQDTHKVLEGISNKLVAVIHIDYTPMNDLMIKVDTSESESGMTEGIHRILLELTSRKVVQ